MPYSHYKALGSPPPNGTMIDSLRDILFMLNYGPTSFFSHIDIYQSGQVIPDYSVTKLDTGLYPLTYNNNTYPLNYSFPSNNTDSADFLIKSYLNDDVVRLNKYNDTSYYYQHFYNYYSYDDGSAEVSYGIKGNADVSIAYEFNLKMADTLRGVQIYFNPTGVDVSNKLFQLTVWSDVNVGLNQSTELYKMIDQKPDTFNGINGFKTYLFDQTLIVGPGNIWVGFIQNEPHTLYGIGLDKNTDSRNKMFYHIDGIWSQSPIKGSWLMRPFFGKKIPLVGVDEINQSVSTFSISPNPATSCFKLRLLNVNEKNYHYQIYNCMGSIVKEDDISISSEINISGFNKGIYFVKLFNTGNKNLTVQKLIIQ